MLRSTKSEHLLCTLYMYLISWQHFRNIQTSSVKWMKEIEIKTAINAIFERSRYSIVENSKNYRIDLELGTRTSMYALITLKKTRSIISYILIILYDVKNKNRIRSSPTLYRFSFFFLWSFYWYSKPVQISGFFFNTLTFEKCLLITVGRIFPVLSLLQKN